MPELPPGATEMISRALEEDLGSGDLTTEATVPVDLRANARIVLKQPGVVFGLAVVEQVFSQTGVTDFDRVVAEGDWNDSVPTDVALIHGSARTILAGERVALNFLGHLSGISTLTARFVDAVAGTGAKILDTRKTTPGLRLLEKESVVAGGGVNHRIGLFDAILIKENHIAMSGGVGKAVDACRAARPEMMVEIEAEDIVQVDDAISAGADRILLDNMTREEMEAAVAARDRSTRASSEGRRIELEASGGVDLANVRRVAETGVDFVSIGALTHSAPVLDFSLLIEPV